MLPNLEVSNIPPSKTSRGSKIWSSQAEAEVAPNIPSPNPPTMTLKNAAPLAVIGTILMTALVVCNFVLTFLNVLRDLVPAVTLFSSFIYAFGCLTVIVFFFVFRQAQC